MQDASAHGSDPVYLPLVDGRAARRHDRVASAFVSVALARLERDHVALLAAICDLETQRGKPRARTRTVDSPALLDALASVLREDLRQTQHALDLAAQGVFGYCERCHTALSSSILLNHPATTRCPDCAAAVERSSQIH